jgi:hypothetical protein
MNSRGVLRISWTAADHLAAEDPMGCIPAWPGRAVVLRLEPRRRVSTDSGFHPLHEAGVTCRHRNPDRADEIGR